MTNPPNPLKHGAVASRIREAMTRLNLTPQMVGNLVGVTYQSIVNWEQARHAVGSTHRKKLAEVLHLKESDLDDKSAVLVSTGKAVDLYASGPPGATRIVHAKSPKEIAKLKERQARAEADAPMAPVSGLVAFAYVPGGIHVKIDKILPSDKAQMLMAIMASLI